MPPLPPPPLTLADLPAKTRRVTQQGSTFYVIGDERALLRDAYHIFLRLRWSASIGLIAAGFAAANLVFAALYYAIGGGAGAGGSFFVAPSFCIPTPAASGSARLY